MSRYKLNPLAKWAWKDRAYVGKVNKVSTRIRINKTMKGLISSTRMLADLLDVAATKIRQVAVALESNERLMDATMYVEEVLDLNIKIIDLNQKIEL